MSQKKESMNLIVKSFIHLINNPKTNGVDRYIASRFIQDYQKVYDLSISEISVFFHVSYSQMSRFVRNIGFDSYREFRESLLYHGSSDRHSDIQVKSPISMLELKNNIIEEIEYFFHYFDMTQLYALIQDLHQYKHIAFFGLLNSGNVARDIQMNLASKGLICVCYDDLFEQLEFMKNADKQTLIVIISVSGDYLLGNDYARYYKVQNILKNSMAKKIMITKNPKIKELDMIDNVIQLPVSHHYYNHTLQCFADLLTMYYH